MIEEIKWPRKNEKTAVSIFSNSTHFAMQSKVLKMGLMHSNLVNHLSKLGSKFLRAHGGGTLSIFGRYSGGNSGMGGRVEIGREFGHIRVCVDHVWAVG